MIEVIDLNEKKQPNCRTMICQLNSKDFDWNENSGLHFVRKTDKIITKVIEFLKIAKHNSSDVVIFPELSIPETLIGKLQDWSRENETIVIGGSHYHKKGENYISRCPVIIKGAVYFTEKITLSPLEKSPIKSEGCIPGKKIIKFINSFIGDFAVLICADYLNDFVKSSLDLNSLDLLCIPSFQRDSEVYYRRMNIDCENSKSGIYLLYSNFIDYKYGDGNSSIFGLMDRLYTKKLKNANYTDLNPNNKLFQFKSESEYFIADVDLINKRAYSNRSILTSPNLVIISVDSQTSNKDLAFIQKVSQDDERYKRIDELFVEPNEYHEILKTIENHNIVFIVGDPGIGKTYSAVKILKEYYEKGYEPIWFSGLDKEERETQSKVLTQFYPASGQIVYFEDPFGRTTFERRDGLLQIFTPLIDKLSQLDCKVIITSRTEIFEKFTNESLLESEILNLKTELNLRNPSYNHDSLCKIFDKLGSIICEWYEKENFRELVYNSIKNDKIKSPLAIRDLLFVSKSISTKSVLQNHIDRREKETIKTFALEILSTSLSIKLILYLIYFCGTKGKPFLSKIFLELSSEFKEMNFDIGSYSFNVEIRSQLGYRVEQFGFHKTVYRFSHPIYEEALSNLIISDKKCEFISTKIISNLVKKDTKAAYRIINRLVPKYPNVSLLLFNNLLDTSHEKLDSSLKIILSQKLISAYHKTKDEDFFDLACKFFDLNKLIDSINKGTSWKELLLKLNLCIRFKNNSPNGYDIGIINNIIWDEVFSRKNDKENFLNPTQLLHLLFQCFEIFPESLSIYLDKKGENDLKKMYLVVDYNDRNRLYKLFNGYKIQKDFKSFRKVLYGEYNNKLFNKYQLIRRVIFSEKVIYGKIVIDNGAYYAIKKPWLNLLPAGIKKIYGDFSSGSIVGIFNKDVLVGVGMAEYSSKDLNKLKGYSSNSFFEIIGYYHTNCAIKSSFLILINSKKERSSWKDELQFMI